PVKASFCPVRSGWSITGICKGGRRRRRSCTSAVSALATMWGSSPKNTTRGLTVSSATSRRPSPTSAWSTRPSTCPPRKAPWTGAGRGEASPSSSGGWCVAQGLPLQLVILDLAVQRRALDAEDVRRLALVPVGVVERPQDVLFFNRFEGQGLVR